MKKKPIIPILFTVLSAIALAAVIIMQDAIVINYRIRGYRSILNLCIAALCVAGAWLIAAFALGISQSKKERMLEPEPEPVDQEDKKEMDEEARGRLYSDLLIYSQDKWKDVKGISTLLSQLDSMNEYQSKLDPLLEQNGYLKQKPAEIVQRLENCMYVNIRKLLNYMSVLQARSAQAMSEKVRQCIEKNTALLDKTDEFVLKITDYVNDDMAPGEEGRAKEYVDNYMYLVLDAITLPETYLK